MSKRKDRERPAKKRTVQQAPIRAVPNRPLFGLALLGAGLAAYLTFTAWSGQSLAGCTVGSPCDVVLSSRWSTLLGLPTSFWGVLTYAGLAGIAFVKREDLHWKLAWSVSLFGVLYSLYLTGVSLFALDAACPYCLTSLALMGAIFALVAYQRPVTIPRFSWKPWLLRTVSGGLAVVLLLHLHYAGVAGTSAAAEDPWVRGLAEHLTTTKAKFYGASWCPHCADQKERFGSSAHRLPYVECSPLGRGTAQAPVCNQAGVNVYPTWIIQGKRHEGLLSLSDLARFSAFQGGSP
jgi:uncharacterized membrane protein